MKNKVSVFFLNLFLGWTIIGFFVLIFYASLTNPGSNESVGDFMKGKSKKRIKFFLSKYDHDTIRPFLFSKSVNVIDVF